MGTTEERERVREVIRGSGLTDAQFAKQIEMDPTKLSKSLSGARRFTSFELATIASTGGTTIDWLLGGTATPVAIAARRNDERRAAISRAVKRAEEYVELDDLLRRLADIAKPLRPLPAVPQNPRAIDAGPELAELALAMIDEAAPNKLLREDPWSTIETAFDVNVAVDAFDDGLDGLTYQTESFRLILVNNQTSWSRQRFTLAHELAHVLAQDGQAGHGVRVDRDVMDTAGPDRLVEIRANAFAAAFLMPPAEVRSMFAEGATEQTFARAIGRFRVSPSAMAWRLVSLAILDRDSARPFLGMPVNQAARIGGWEEELDELTQRQSLARPPVPLAARSARAFLAGHIGARPMASVLNIPPETLLPEPCADLAGEEPVFAP
jgi:Zn-dependent peptidase ImmA (M78 family)